MTSANIITNTIRRTSGSRPIATVTISRPSKLNSLNSHLLNLLAQEIRSIPQSHPDLLAVILTGHGTKSFVGGADIGEMATLASPAAAREFITKVHTACKSIRDCPVPVIGRINGYALGAGLEIAASCDFRVASRNAVFGMPEVCLPRCLFCPRLSLRKTKLRYQGKRWNPQRYGSGPPAWVNRMGTDTSTTDAR